MNLSQGATELQLVELLASVDDEQNAHILYVTNQGDVHIEPVPDELSPAQWAEENKDRIRFRFETFGVGNGYAGAEAAADPAYTKRILQALIENWSNEEVGYIDDF